jgi:ankyrin repeat protein
MERKQLKQLWSETLVSPNSTPDDYDRLAQGVMDVYRSDDADFRQHVKNRAARVTEATGQSFDADNFDIDMARAFIADEIGFGSWNALVLAVKDPAKRKYPLLFHYTMAALWRGDFTALDQTIGGSDAFDEMVIEWYEKGCLADETDTTAELFAAACWLGHTKSAEYLLDKGVDPYAGMRTGLSGFHWAASSGKLDVIKLLIERKVPMDVKSMYDSTVLWQALWSAINEHTEFHAQIVESLIEGGAYVGPNTLEWWLEQSVPSEETKTHIADALRRHAAD